MNYLPTCTSRLVVQHPCQVSFKSMQGCRRSWEDKLSCDGMTEWRNDGMTEWRTKQTLNAPLPFYGGGIKSHSQGHKVIDLGVILKGFISWVCMPYMKSLSLTVQKLYMSKVRVVSTHRQAERTTRHVFAKHGCPWRQQSQNMAKSLSPKL